MKDKYGDKRRLEHIVESLQSIFKSFENITEKDFLLNTEKRNSIIYEFIIIGEACHNISEETKNKYTNIAWRFAYRMRNKLVHEYPNIQLEILWKTVKNDLPKFEKDILEILKQENFNGLI
ncbi:MAG: DUF86 domain-containing protein [Bacteroidetes bacterium]|nr:MAG: DUF86 domain-containing protein [Bacteroidota bacterium]